MFQKKHLKFFILGIGLIIFLVWIIWSIVLSAKSISHLEEFELEQAKVESKKAVILPQILSQVTFRKIHTVEAWRISLTTIPKLAELNHNWQNFAGTLFTPEDTKPDLDTLAQSLQIINSDLTQLNFHLKNSLFLKKSQHIEKIDKLTQAGDDLVFLLTEIVEKPHTAIVALQNTDEIRATGGFLGSYAKIELDNSGIKSFKIEDIYQPDGQFTGYITPPPGLDEYLSSGKGMRLPDSNWHPDFPSSAKQMLSMFSLGGETNVDSLVTLNVDTIEQVLEITGDVFLPDYGVNVDAQNLSELARADRDQFFAGSKQKPQFLRHLMDNLILKLENLSPDQQLALLQTLLQSLKNKNIQIYSSHENFQSLIEKYNWDGGLSKLDEDSLTLASIESNVGINKANKNVFRSTAIDIEDDRAKIAITFQNKNLIGLDYLNYHRILTDEDVEVTNILLDGQSLIYINREVITNSSGEKFNQVGFLLPIPAGSEKNLIFNLEKSRICENNCKLNLIKQSGIPPTPYAISLEGISTNILLETDQILQLQSQGIIEVR